MGKNSAKNLAVQYPVMRRSKTEPPQNGRFGSHAHWIYYCLDMFLLLFVSFFFFSSCMRFMTHHQTVVEDVKITVAPDDLGTNTNTQTQLVEVELGL